MPMPIPKTIHMHVHMHGARAHVAHGARARCACMLVELTCAADAMPNTTRVTHLGNAAKAMATWGGLQAGLRRGEGLSWVRITVSG